MGAWRPSDIQRHPDSDRHRKGPTDMHSSPVCDLGASPNLTEAQSHHLLDRHLNVQLVKTERGTGRCLQVL